MQKEPNQHLPRALVPPAEAGSPDLASQVSWQGESVMAIAKRGDNFLGASLLEAGDHVTSTYHAAARRVPM